ncbi:MAG: flippase-like domain-containing protein [Burkholderiales bacterium]|nr:flippase-like domain-containing protein [Burkholderiales bacterium]
MSLMAIGRRHLRALILSVAAAAAGYLAFSLWGGWAQVGQALAQVGWTGLAVLLALSLVNYGLRFVRWQLYLTALGHAQPWRASLRIYLAGFALTTTPGKAGEALRSLFLQHRGMPVERSLAALISERLSDLVAVVLLCLIGLSQFPGLRLMVVVAVGLIVVVYVAIARARPVVGQPGRPSAQFERSPSRLRSALARVQQLLASARPCHTPALLLSTTALSLIAWAAEAWAFHLLLGVLGSNATLSFSVFVYAIAVLAGALSFLPGGLGGTEATMMSLLLLAGHEQAVAVVATVLIRLTTLWFAVAIGLIALLRLMREPTSAPATSTDESPEAANATASGASSANAAPLGAHR